MQYIVSLIKEIDKQSLNLFDHQIAKKKILLHISCYVTTRLLSIPSSFTFFFPTLPSCTLLFPPHSLSAPSSSFTPFRSDPQSPVALTLPSANPPWWSCAQRISYQLVAFSSWPSPEKELCHHQEPPGCPQLLSNTRWCANVPRRLVPGLDVARRDSARLGGQPADTGEVCGE